MSAPVSADAARTPSPHVWGYRRLGQAKRRPNEYRYYNACWVIATLDPTYIVPRQITPPLTPPCQGEGDRLACAVL